MSVWLSVMVEAGRTLSFLRTNFRLRSRNLWRETAEIGHIAGYPTSAPAHRSLKGKICFGVSIRGHLEVGDLDLLSRD